ncbi:MAG: ATP-binding cassette domain-containing protein [Actinomycetota bacterium]|nr:ATP-binding cassette domain-containing protein [Actinomycetota bacterium]
MATKDPRGRARPAAAPKSPAAPGSPAGALRLSGVTVERSGRTILHPLDWEVGPHDRWVVLGPNGSGKTTLLQVAGARLRPSRGCVSIVGERVGRCDLRTVRARVALVSAATVRLIRPDLTVHQVVVSGRDGALSPFWHRYADEDWAAAAHSLSRVLGSEEAPPLDTPFGVLSEGERQQVLIARSLMCSPELVLFDEPAAGLDLGARERLAVQLGSLAADPEVPAVVLVTHHLEEVPPGFTHAMLLRGGRLLAAGRLEEVLTGALVSACFGVGVEVERRKGRWWARAAPHADGASRTAPARSPRSTATCGGHRSS